MPRLELTPRVFRDFERILDHMAALDMADPGRFDGIMQALEILQSSPLIGRPVKGAKRELVIGRGARAYVALYRFSQRLDTVFILAIKSQRESGYKR